jgi:hypothetical protein
MKKLILIFAVAASTVIAYGQSPVADPDTLKNPVKQIDPEVKQEPADIHYVDEMTRIGADELPPVVLDSLKKAEPASWEKSVMYRDKKEGLFLVHVREGGQEKTYRFNKDGRRLKNLDEREND